VACPGCCALLECLESLEGDGAEPLGGDGGLG
jgi:hypothetical protein